jgi:hypothetical protein
MNVAALASRPHARVKAVIFALLAANAAAYAFFGRPTEALDSIAWFVLLVLFELETAHPQSLRGSAVPALVHAARFVAAVAVAIAAAGYFHEREWLDAINAALWIAVVAVLEVEVRFLAAVARHRRAFAAVLGMLYAGLAALALAWAWQGAWFDAYDAALWLAAFVAIEINVLEIARAPGYGQVMAPECGAREC